jgi:hypothetical protein
MSANAQLRKLALISIVRRCAAPQFDLPSARWRLDVRLLPIAIFAIFSDDALMSPPSHDAPQKVVVALFAVFALGACQAKHQLCLNSNPRWTYNPRGPDQVVDVLVVTQAGKFEWNGETISQQQLVSWLDIKGGMITTPTTLLRHKDGADCSKVAAARTLMSKSLDCASGQCAEGREWDAIPDNGFNGFDGGGEK